jgi:transposase, IS30 family
MPYTHLSATERGQIQVLHSQGHSIRFIAFQLGRSPSTVSRELLRQGRVPYVAVAAQARYVQARKECIRSRSLSHPALRSHVFQKLSEGWSPEQISGRLWVDYPGQPRMRVSHETIYRNLYEEEQFRVLIGCLRQRRPRRRKRGGRKVQRSSIPNRVGIEARPACVEALERHGDWEGDLIIGAGQQGAVLTLVERKSMLLRAMPLPSRNAQGAAAAVVRLLQSLPCSWRRTITFDNGSEFAAHQSISQQLDAQVYFAHPYAAYERGRIENTNGLLRQYLPKQSSFKHLTQDKLQRCVDDLNDRPRKKLCYRTPNEVFKACTVALTV